MKPLTPKMIEMLMDCHEREILKQEPYATHFTQTAKGLVTRLLFTTSMYKSPASGKSYMAFYITNRGKKYLESYCRI